MLWFEAAKDAMDRQRQSQIRWKSEKGQALLEGAFVLLTLLLLILAMVDFASMFYVYQSLENGINQATRFAVTGQTKQGVDPITGQPITLNRAASIKKAMQEATTLDLSTASYTFTNITNPVGDPTGSPGDIIRVAVSYDWPIVTPLIGSLFNNGKVRLTVSSAVKNEPSPNF
jgi:Flp pilus assembly protein TadG